MHSPPNHLGPLCPKLTEREHSQSQSHLWIPAGNSLNFSFREERDTGWGVRASDGPRNADLHQRHQRSAKLAQLCASDWGVIRLNNWHWGIRQTQS